MGKLVKAAIFVTSVLFAGVSSAQTPAHGVQEFRKTGTFVVDAGVSQVTVKLWGAGVAGAGGNVGAIGPGSGAGGAGKLITDGAESGKPGGDGSAIVSW